MRSADTAWHGPCPGEVASPCPCGPVARPGLLGSGVTLQGPARASAPASASASVSCHVDSSLSWLGGFGRAWAVGAGHSEERLPMISQWR